MEDLILFPTLTSRMKSECGFLPEDYTFYYMLEGEKHGLDSVKTKKKVGFSDKDDIWKIEKDGLFFTRTIRFAYPDMLKGPSGVACRGAELGVCIIWTCKATTQTGYILPKDDITSPSGRTIRFEHKFSAGSVDGMLTLDSALYIKKAAIETDPGEENLMNDAGVIVGHLDCLTLEFKNKYMEFPIEECNSASEPLWWLSIGDWEDPREIDMFSKESVCLHLNVHYRDACPTSSDKGENGILNFDMLVDILAQTYFLLFEELKTWQLLNDTINGIGLAEGTVCYVLHQFIEGNQEDLNWDRPELLLKSLQKCIRKMLQREEV